MKSKVIMKCITNTCRKTILHVCYVPRLFVDLVFSAKILSVARGAITHLAGILGRVGDIWGLPTFTLPQ